ncbi:hypothetical protein ABN362_05475 [Providencia alcalifaciens]|uniref:F4 family fimbrial subunit n=1 Tax=Providencia alcalifaciens TaxID=126385 RepID=UPI0032D9CFB4
MKLYRLGLLSVALTTTLFGGAANADEMSSGSINHDIKFGGVIIGALPEWHWVLPTLITRIDLEQSAATNASGVNTWDILENHKNPLHLLEGYMDATTPGIPFNNLSPLISYVQGGATVTTTTTGGLVTLPLEAEANDGTKGTLKLTITPVLLASNGAPAGGTLTVQPMPNQIASPDTAVPIIYNAALTKLETKLGDVTGATGTTYVNTELNGSYLDNGQDSANPVIAGYASGITAGELSFTDAITPTMWKSVFTVQVAYN